MKIATLDVKSLVIGLLLGVCTILAVAAARGEAPQKLDADYRYQISATSQFDSNNQAIIQMVYILDHETNKIYVRQLNPSSRDYDVKSLLKN